MVDPATVDQQFEEIIRNSTSYVPIPMRMVTVELAARVLVLTCFTAAVLIFEVRSILVVLMAFGLVALAAGEALVDRRSSPTPSEIRVHV